MNSGKRWLALLAAAVLAVVLPASAAEAGLVAYYDFEEGTGVIVNDVSGGLGIDDSGWVYYQVLRFEDYSDWQCANYTLWFTF